MKNQQQTEYESQTKSVSYVEAQQKLDRSKSYLFQQPQYKISKKNYEMIETIIKTMEQNQFVDEDNMYCIYKEDYDIQYILNNNGIKVVVRRYNKWEGAKLLNYQPPSSKPTGLNFPSTNTFPNATEQWSVILSDFNLQILKGVPYKQFFTAMKKKQYFQPRITKNQVSFVLKYDVIINYNKFQIQKQFNFSKDNLSNVQIEKLYYMHQNMLKLRSKTKSQINLLKNYLEKTNKIQDSY